MRIVSQARTTKVNAIKDMTATDELVFEFFKKFSSFESVLRIKKMTKAGSVLISWEVVKGRLKSCGFLLSDEQKRFTIIVHPPKELRYCEEKGGLSWELSDIGNDDSEIVVEALRRLRNNLFHGSKRFGNATESDRNISLIRGALLILESVIDSLGYREEYTDIVDYWS